MVRVSTELRTNLPARVNSDSDVGCFGLRPRIGVSGELGRSQTYLPDVFYNIPVSDGAGSLIVARTYQKFWLNIGAACIISVPEESGLGEECGVVLDEVVDDVLADEMKNHVLPPRNFSRVGKGGPDVVFQGWCCAAALAKLMPCWVSILVASFGPLARNGSMKSVTA